MEKKAKNVPYVRGQNSTIVTELTITNNNNNVNDGDNRSSNPSDFVTSSSFAPFTPSNVVINTSTNVVSTTTPSFVPPEIELSIPPHYYSPSLLSEETSDTPPHSSLYDDIDDDATVEMYNNLINGGQITTKQADK
jgi:hypothetical protein